MSMTKDELFVLHENLNEMGLKVMRAKNEDYSTGVDPFSNFRGSLFIGIEPELGLLLRVMDKIKRIEAFVKTGKLKVIGESCTDAIVDIRNYMVLLQGLIQEREELKDKC